MAWILVCCMYPVLFTSCSPYGIYAASRSPPWDCSPSQGVEPMLCPRLLSERPGGDTAGWAPAGARMGTHCTVLTTSENR